MRYGDQVITQMYIGIDIGGTMIRVGALNQRGDLLSVDENRWEPNRGVETGLEQIKISINRVLANSDCGDLLGIGLGVTGPVNPITGTINNPFNLPGWDNVPIVSWLEKLFSVPVILENDADMAALGEYWKGAGKNAHRLYAVTVGTGIGSAFIIEGKIYRGMNGAHPEAGHHVIDLNGPVCYCGTRGCWEILTSGSAIAAQAQSRLTEDPYSLLWYLSNNKPDTIDARMVAEAAQQGDTLAVSIIKKVSEHFSLGLTNILMVYAPDFVVLSGGVMKSIDLWMPAIQTAIQSRNKLVPLHQIKVVPAQLGYYAGLYGSAYAILCKVERVHEKNYQ